MGRGLRWRQPARGRDQGRGWRGWSRSAPGVARGVAGCEGCGQGVVGREGRGQGLDRLGRGGGAREGGAGAEPAPGARGRDLLERRELGIGVSVLFVH